MRKIEISKNIQNHITVLLGSYVIGIVNFASSFILLKIADKQTFNLYTALSAFIFILSAPNSLIINLSTTYGTGLISFFARKSFGKNRIILFISTLIIIFTLAFVTNTLTNASVPTSLFISGAVVLTVPVSFVFGLLQHKHMFNNYFSVNILLSLSKLFFGVVGFFVLGMDGIWAATFVITLLLAIYVFRKRSHLAEPEKTFTINFRDIVVNLGIFVVVEVLLNIDSVIVLRNLSEGDAFIYNSLSLVRKAIFFSVVGFSAILISDARKKDVDKFVSLARSLGITILVGGIISIVFFLSYQLVLPIIGLDSSHFALYAKFVIASLLFAILLIFTKWFTYLKSMLIRGMVVLSILSFAIIYGSNIRSIDTALNTVLIGSSLLIASFATTAATIFLLSKK